MGVGFSHCRARWSYSGFNSFRCLVADTIGFGEYKDIKTTDDPRYEKLGSDPIRHLLAHSDCDGVIAPEHCGPLAKRLREVVALWPLETGKVMALAFAGGLEAAAEAGEQMEFL